ncbi:MAG TPA: hypothetical protein VNQ90_18460, partial [Chthoniobacteraceae bacterium]|nr:hypothetical protein [Chthoniobacteraceae bacterium]
SGGDYLDPSYWLPAQTPGTADGTVFNLSAAEAYVVTLSDDATNQSLWVVNDRLTLDLNGQSLALTDTAASGDGERGLSLATKSLSVAELTIRGGGQLTTQTFYAAALGTAKARLTVSGSGTIWTHEGTTTAASSLAWKGDASLRVEAGAALDFNRLYLSGSVGSKAELLVTGSGTTASFSNRIEVGYRSTATLRVEQQASLTAGRLVVGSLGSKTEANGTVTGVNSLLSVTTLDVGTADTTASLKVEDGGKLTVSGVTGIATSTDASRVGSGRLEVRGTGSRFEAGEAIHVAGAGGVAGVSSGTLLLADGGLLEGYQDAVLYIYENGTLSMERDATFRVRELQLKEGAGFAVALNSGLTLGEVREDLLIETDVALQLTLGSGFSATVGDSIALIEYGGEAAGAFAGLGEGAVLNVGGYQFQISYGSGSNDAVRLEVQAIPEPEPALALLGAGIVLLAARRFR